MIKYDLTTKEGVISLIISLASASLNTQEIIIPHMKIRGQINLFISSPFGTMKSTMLNEIAEKHKSQVYTSMTFPSLVGTIDGKTNQLIPGVCWDARNNFMLIDEYYAPRKNVLSDALLQIMEGGKYTRKIGRSTLTPISEKDNKGLYFVADNKGFISTQTRVSTIITSMYPIGIRLSTQMKALISRCIPLRFVLAIEELEEIALGKKMYHPIKEIVRNSKPKNQNVKPVIISAVDYKKIVSFTTRFFPKKGDGSYLRCVGECCRIFAILGFHDEKLYEFVIKLQNNRGIW